MKHVRRAICIITLGAMLLLCGVPAFAAGPPMLPAFYWGSVETLDGSPVTSGEVEAIVDGDVCGSIDIINGKYGSPPPGRGLVVQGVGGIDLTGKTVQFRVKGIFAVETVTWKSQDTREVNLTVDLPGEPETPGSGGPSGGGSLPPVQPKTPMISDQAIKNAINRAAQTGKVTIESPGEGKQLSLSFDQFKDIQATGKPMEIKINNVTMLIDPGALQIPDLGPEGIAQVNFSAVPLSDAEAREAIAQADNSGLFTIAGEIFDLSITVVGKNGREYNIQKFNGKIQVTLPVPQNARDLAAQGRLTVGYYNEQTKTWEDIGGVYDPDTGTITFETDHFSKYAVMVARSAPAVSFSDIVNHWARKDIEFMASRGLVSGVGNGMFAPEEKITRAQFAAFLVRILGISEATGNLEFSDVKAGAWYYSSLFTAYQSGLIKGVGDGKIAPNDNITREQMAAMVIRAMEYKGKAIPEAAELTFTDKASVSDWARSAISQSAQLKIIGGFPDGSFGPRKNATRAEAIVMLHRVYNQIQ